MSNKITGVTPGLIQSANTKPASHEKTGSSAAPGSSSAKTDSTTVNITRDAKLLGELDQALASASDIDATKIAAIKEAIANGEYEIDAEKIAAALLKFDRDAGGA